MKRDNTKLLNGQEAGPQDVAATRLKLPVAYRGVVPTKLQWADEVLVVPFRKAPIVSVAGPDIVQFLDGAPADPKTWPDPVHVAFANMNFDDSRRMEFFVKKYGVSGHFFDLHSDGLQLPPEGRQWVINPAFVRNWQEKLRRAWRGRTLPAGEQPIPEVRPFVPYRSGETLWFHPRSMTVTGTNHRLQVIVSDLWTLICVSFLNDHECGRTQVCGFAGCKFLRYFIKSRSEQQFCSKQCRALHNMGVWRGDPKNREREKMRRNKRYALQHRKLSTKRGQP